MRPAREGEIPVRVKNSYNPKAPGTLITKSRDMSKVCSSRIIMISSLRALNFQTCHHNLKVYLTAGSADKHSFEAERYHVGYCQYSHAWSIWLPCKGDISISLASYLHFISPLLFCLLNRFTVQVFSTFEDLGISVDVVATSEVSISLTLDPSKFWSRELIQQASI